MKRTLAVLAILAMALIGGVAGRFVENAVGPAQAGITSVAGWVCTTWSPQMNFGGGHTGMTQSLANGNVCKQGKLEWIEADITLSGKGSSTGQMSIDGLPTAYKTLNDSGSGCFFSIAVSNLVTVASTAHYQGGIPSNNVTLAVARMTDVSGVLTEVFLSNTDFNNNSYLKMSGICQANA